MESSIPSPISALSCSSGGWLQGDNLACFCKVFQTYFCELKIRILRMFGSRKITNGLCVAAIFFKMFPTKT